MNTKNGFITELEEHEYFVFGSNLLGKHIGGAAKTAKDKFGAIEGIGVGLQGQSWAIPTLDQNFEKMPLEVIGLYLRQLAIVALEMPEKTFYLTKIGQGIANFSEEEIKSITPNFPSNVIIL